MVLYVIVRLRGTVDVPEKVDYTLRLLRLVKPYHAVLYPKTPVIDGMLGVVKDWITWGEISKDVLRLLIIKRGRLVGGKRITEDDVRRVFRVNTVDELVDHLYDGRVLWHKFDSYVKPIFRLHPPKGGFRGSVRKPFNTGGELGYRGQEINNLLLDKPK